jgi:predicted permease
MQGGLNGWGIQESAYSLSAPLFEEIRDHQQAFSQVFAWSSDAWFPVGSGMQARRVRGLMVSGNFFEALGVPAAAGRLVGSEDDLPGCASPGVVLSYGLWQSEFGGAPSAIGSPITIQDRRFEVIGVTPQFFTGLDVGRNFDFAMPKCAQGLLDRDASTRSDVSWLTVMGRLKPGWSVSQAADHLRAISPSLMEATLPSGYASGVLQMYRQFRLEAIPAATGVSELRYYYATPLWLLLGITALVLLIACANVADLMLARGSARRREFAVRLALGASRFRLLRQSLSESALLALSGAACGLVLAQALSRVIVALLTTEDSPVFLDLHLDGRVLAFTIAAGAAACFFFGIAPALRALGVDPGTALQSAGRATAAQRSRFSTQRSLIVCQVALSLVLVVGALLFTHSFRNLVTVNPGFRESGVVEAQFNSTPLHLSPAAIKPFQRELLEEIRSVPGVEAAATTTFRLLEGGDWNLIVRTSAAERESRFAMGESRLFRGLGDSNPGGARFRFERPGGFAEGCDHQPDVRASVLPRDEPARQDVPDAGRTRLSVVGVPGGWHLERHQIQQPARGDSADDLCTGLAVPGAKTVAERVHPLFHASPCGDFRREASPERITPSDYGGI